MGQRQNSGRARRRRPIPVMVVAGLVGCDSGRFNGGWRPKSGEGGGAGGGLMGLGGEWSTGKVLVRSYGRARHGVELQEQQWRLCFLSPTRKKRGEGRPSWL